MRSIVLSILALAALYLLGNGRVQLWDRDEPRYAQASRQMLHSGDWVVPKLLDQPRINKPPLIYWCQASAMSILGDNALAARLPSAIAMTLTLLLLAVTLRKLAGPQQALWTIIVFGTSGLVMMAAKMCLTDSVLLLFVTASQLCIYALWRGRRETWIFVALGISLGLALLTKGPVVLGANATTLVVLALMRWWDQRGRGEKIEDGGLKMGQEKPLLHPPSSILNPQSSAPTLFAKPLLAFAILLVIALPWVIAMQHRLPGGLAGTFRHDVLQRMTTPLEQHKGPPGYYLLFSLASFFPWVLLLPTAAKFAWQSRRDPLLRFSLAAVIGPWLMFELIQTKLPHYVLPCFPFLAIITAHTILRSAAGKLRDWHEKGWRIAAGAWSLAVIALGAMPWLAALPRFGFDHLPWLAMVTITAVSAICALAVFVFFARQKILAAASAMAGAMAILFALLYGWYLPEARFLHLSEDVGGFLRSDGATTKGDVVMIDYKEDSLPFYQGGTIRPQPKNTYLTQTPPQEWPTYLVLTREIWQTIPDSARERLEVLKIFRGWAYAAKGRIVEVMVVKKK